MKILKLLEKNKVFWFLLISYLVFFLLRLPSLIEPNWYGDEGIYQVIGKALVENRILYAQIWDNKPPLLYITYALFNGEQFQIRFFSLFSGLLAVIALFYLSRLLFKNFKSSIISTSVFILLFATPLMEGNIANAENFMLFPIITSGFLVYSYSQDIKLKIFDTRYKLLLGAGLLLGLAFLFKIVAIFDIAAFLVFLLIVNTPERFRFTITRLLFLFKSIMMPLLPLIVGFIFPLGITGLYFISQNAFSEFTTATFFSNVGYVGYGNKLIIPQGLLLLKLSALLIFVFLIFKNRKVISTPITFILIWFAFSLFNTFFSGRPYMHYTLVVLPSLCLAIGLLQEKMQPKLKYLIIISLILSFTILNKNFKFNLIRTFNYYGNAASFIIGKKDSTTYQSFFDRKTPRDYEIASYIRARTQPEDEVFIWGDNAQIYALSDKIPPGKYTVSYHIVQYENAIPETESAITNSNPKYIVILKNSRSFPFSLSGYDRKTVFQENLIYERNY
ncbi:MAG TPA: glycosyltransferase family 39 protein [Candidatus Limnocylindrales bacterium]|nr:glycosyltransferase family 39 protein [Candidatus Limnocylindrales bacterium]